MKFIFYLGGVFGWVLLIYYGRQGFPLWLKSGASEVVNLVPEIARQLPKSDEPKPSTETKPEDKKPGENKPEESKSETSKSLFSGEIKVGKLRSK